MWSLFCVFGFCVGVDCRLRGSSWRSGAGGGFAIVRGIWERRVGFESLGSGGGCVPCLSCGGSGRRWMPSLRDLVVGLAGLVGRGWDTLRCYNYHLEGAAFLSCGHGCQLSLTGRYVSLFRGTDLVLAELGEVD